MQLFENHFPENLGEELAIARRLGITPLQVGEAGFDVLINEGTLKWVITDAGVLLVVPHTVNGIEIHHPVMSGIRAVQAAGEAEISGDAGNYLGLSINNHRGHFQPTPDSLEIALEKFALAGIVFAPDGIERIG